jgi:hypothetical protein
VCKFLEKATWNIISTTCFRGVNGLYIMIDSVSFVVQELVSVVITRPSESSGRDLIFSKEKRGWCIWNHGQKFGTVWLLTMRTTDQFCEFKMAEMLRINTIIIQMRLRMLKQNIIFKVFTSRNVQNTSMSIPRNSWRVTICRYSARVTQFYSIISQSKLLLSTVKSPLFTKLRPV